MKTFPERMKKVKAMADDIANRAMNGDFRTRTYWTKEYHIDPIVLISDENQKYLIMDGKKLRGFKLTPNDDLIKKLILNGKAKKKEKRKEVKTSKKVSTTENTLFKNEKNNLFYAGNDRMSEYDHPLWIAKSNRIRVRDGNTCKICGCTDSYMKVHHPYYINTEPKPPIYDDVAYPDSVLFTVCVNCHNKLKDERAVMLDTASRKFTTLDDIKFMTKFMVKLADVPVNQRDNIMLSIVI